MRIGILTVSDLGAKGERTDTSGDAILAWAGERGYDVSVRSVVPDEPDRIAATLVRWADSGEVDVILTTGGTGLTERDVTPEATQAVLERAAPGIAEALPATAAPRLPPAWLPPGGAGLHGLDRRIARVVRGAAAADGARPLHLDARAGRAEGARSQGPGARAGAHRLPREARRPGRGHRHGATADRAPPAAGAHRHPG